MVIIKVRSWYTAESLYLFIYIDFQLLFAVLFTTGPAESMIFFGGYFSLFHRALTEVYLEGLILITQTLLFCRNTSVSISHHTL